MKPFDRQNIAVIFGGRSAEHEISVITGLQAIQAIDSSYYQITPVYIAPNGKWYTGELLLNKSFYRRMTDSLHQIQEITLLPDPTIGGLVVKQSQKVIPVDVCFLATHGQFLEDGCLQGLLELADLPYTGCGVTASAMAMDKYKCKAFFKTWGIPVLPSLAVSKQLAKENLHRIKELLSQIPELSQYPLFVKPNHLGSSIGVSVAKDDPSLFISLAKAFQYDDLALIEPYLANMMEINVSVLDGDPPMVSVVEIPVSTDGKTLTYEDKYMRGGNKSKGRQREGMASLTRMINPPQLDPAIKQQALDFALKGFTALRCSGVVRFDFMFDKYSGILYFNELNPIPGSLAYYLWEKSEPPLLYTEVIQHLLERALLRKAEQRSLKRDLGFKALI